MKSFFDSPIGWLELTATDSAVKKIRFLETKPIHYSNNKNDVTATAISELSEYFFDDRTNFTVPLAPSGSSFQKSVWSKLQRIPYGQTVTYGELARKLGDTNKVRAVGKANGQNPIPIIIPCHRVVGKDNNLVGYSGGIVRKQFLLKHEGIILM